MKANKMIFEPANLTAILLNIVNIKSNQCPIWLMELSRGHVSDEMFDNADLLNDQLEPDDILQVFESSLTTLWLYQRIETDTGVLRMETSRFEAERQQYVAVVQERIDLVFDLTQAVTDDVAEIEPFRIFSISPQNIAFEKKHKTKEQIEQTEIQKTIEKYSKDDKQGKQLS